MGLRFRKSFKAGPARVNLSKSGIGFSVGTKGYRVTKMANGRTRKTASIPGTGISYVTESSKKKNDVKESSNINDNKNSNFRNNPQNHKNQPNKKKRWLYILLFLFFPPALIYFAWKKKHWTMFAKIICTAALSFYSLCWLCVIFPPDEKESQTPIVENETIPEEKPEQPQEEEIKNEAPAQEPAVQEPAPTPAPTPTTPTEDTPSQEPTQRKVWVGETGTKYHSRSNCSNMKNARQITIDDAEAQGYSPCKKCY